MRGIGIIAWRDFKSMVLSPLFLIVAGICSVCWSFIYLRALGQFAQRLQMMQMQGMGSGMNILEGLFFPLISMIHLILIFAVPVLTMRLLSEEKRSRTFDLLLTAPITSVDIAVGKFIAAFGAISVLVGVSFLYPLMTRLVTEFNWAPLISAYIGLLFVVAVYVAVGLFTSSLTESGFVAVILALVINVVLWFVGQNNDTAGSPTVFSIMEHMALAENFGNFIKGSISIGSTVFFITVAGFFVFLSERVIESTRWRS